jgi:hypothetical protein
MSDLNSKKENESETIIANKGKTPRTIHTIVSIFYIGVMVLSSPLILWSFAYGYGLLFAVLWAIGSIIVSRILINNNSTQIAYLVLFSTPVITWLFMIQ